VARATVATLGRGTALAAGLALAANAVVFLAGDRGAPVRIVTGAEPGGADLTFGDVAVASVALLIVGTLALALAERVRRDGSGFRLWAIVAVAFAVLSIVPVLRLDIDAGSKVVLGLMHLVVGAAAVAGHVLVRRGPRRGPA
jgi:hypothetical protein